MKTEALPVLLSVLIFSQVSFAQSCARLKDISAGETHTLALADDNSLWVCGAGPLGLGDGANKVLSLQRVHGPNDVGFLGDINDFDAGWEHSLAVDSNGFCWAWGDDYRGKLGNGPNEGSSDFPIRVHGVNDVNFLRNIVAVSAGRSGRHSLAVDVNGYVYAWGENYSGQCGDGTVHNEKQFPVLVVDSNLNTVDKYLGDEANIIDVDAGVDHSLALVALADGGYVYEWGSNNGSSIPKKVPDANGTGYLRYIIDIATCKHSVAADSNGNVWQWTSGYPQRVPGGQMGTTYLEHIVKVAAGGGAGDSNLCAALDSNNNVWQWTIGGLPTKVPDGQMETGSGYLENIVAVDAGYNNFRVAVSSDGYGWGWGVNGYGQLGVGDTNSRPEPNQMLCAEVSGSIYLTKTSEIEGNEPDCVRPFTGNNYLVYEVNCGNLTGPNSCGTVHNINIIDHLPLEVNFYSASDGGVYNADTNTVTWTIDELAPGDSNCFTLTVMVNEYAQPGGEITNFVEMTADEYYSYDTDTVPVCYWGTEIIYVDHDATNGHNNGTDWDNAYTDLRAAFIGAQNSSADATAIWVAAGTYKPTYDMNEGYTLKSFELLEDVGLFGHFGGVGTYETSTSQRNFADANNETILEGQIGSSAQQAVQYVVKAQNIENANVVVDGFTIKGSYSGSNEGAGIYLNNADVSIVNCKLKNNRSDGIYVTNSSAPDIHNCTFIGNRYYGMQVDQSSRPDISYSIFDGNDANVSGVYIGNGSEVSVSSSMFKRHTSYGIDAVSSTLTVTDSNFDGNWDAGMHCSNSDLTVDHSVIANNNHDAHVGNGLFIENNCSLTLTNSAVCNNGTYGLSLNNNSTSTVTIKNNWIYGNGTDGLHLDDSSMATIENNWIYGNKFHGLYLTDHSTVTIKNNWIYDNPYGIYLYYSTSAVTIRNNTIFCHPSLGTRRCGIYTDIDSTQPNISNCILWDNRDDLDNCVATFSCIQNPDDADGNDNTTDDPCFVNSDSNDFHIREYSVCKNNGDQNGNYSGETDIDGENRVYYGRVDMGADEYYLSPADFDEDGIVNFIDYAVLAASWQRKFGDVKYNENCDLADNNTIDFNDLALFCEDWLWEKAGGDEGWMMAMGDGGGRGTDGELLLLDAAASLKARPERLTARSQKFYDITPETTISAIQKALELQLQLQHQAKSKPKPEVQFELEPLQQELQPQPTEIDIQKLVDWLDEIWLNGELEGWTEDKYLEFRKSIEDLPQ